mmetsp:Transcript_2768/g.7720  ORF Transcript_2768/g.7720 Transcript_2768/m.7720 type:complete len:247 (+) Transcript_2768:883-1623(+)
MNEVRIIVALILAVVAVVAMERTQLFGLLFVVCRSLLACWLVELLDGSAGSSAVLQFRPFSLASIPGSCWLSWMNSAFADVCSFVGPVMHALSSLLVSSRLASWSIHPSTPHHNTPHKITPHNTTQQHTACRTHLVQVRQVHHVVHLLEAARLAHVLQRQRAVGVVLEVDLGRLEARGALAAVAQDLFLAVVLRDGHLGDVALLLHQPRRDPRVVIAADVHVVGRGRAAGLVLVSAHAACLSIGFL